MTTPMSTSMDEESQFSVAYKKERATETLTKRMLVQHMIKEQKAMDADNLMAIQQWNTVLDLPLPYLPCTKALDELEDILVTDLQPNSHHRGKCIVPHPAPDDMLFCPTNTTFVATDRNMNSVLVEVMLADRTLGKDGLFPHHTIFAVKEPLYFRDEDRKHADLDDRKHVLSSESVIRVYHLSDIVTIPLPDPRAGEWCSEADEDVSALEWKGTGNIRIKQKSLAEAVAAYTKGITKVAAAETGLQRDLYRNRAQANLALRRWEPTKEDALRALGGDKALDLKAIFRAGRASYELGQYDFRAVIEDSLSSLGEDSDLRKLLQGFEARQREELNGEYNFKAVLSKLNRRNPHADAASYLKRVEARTAGAIAGRGLFAVEDIAVGDLIFCEKAPFTTFTSVDNHCVTRSHDSRTGETLMENMGLWRKVVNSLMHNPALLPKVTQLQGAHRGMEQIIEKVDRMPVIDGQSWPLALRFHDQPCMHRKLPPSFYW